MARIFYRQYPRCSWDPSEPEAPLPGLTLREWEVAVILCSQCPPIAEALRDWLEAPTDRQCWPAATRFPAPHACFEGNEFSQPEGTLLELFDQEITAIRQTLDVPIEAFCGPSRNALLGAHGQRLRWLVRRLGLRRALGAIARCTGPQGQTRAA
jgi:hypothetical protein